MTLRPRVLVLARDAAAVGPLAADLDRLDWRTVTATTLEGALAEAGRPGVEAALLDFGDARAEALEAALRLKAAAGLKRLPVVAVGSYDGGEAGAPVDLIVAPPVHGAQMAMRLESLVRLAVAEEEFEVRSQTFAALGRRLDRPEIDRSALRVLAVGEPSPVFLALSHALSGYGAEATAAFTAYTAFDFLHDRDFDAVVLWAGDRQAEALSIASGMRRNTRLFHTPAVLYMKPGVEIGLAEAYARGLSDVATADTPESSTARRVVALARAFRRETAVRRALDRAKGSGLMDASTGLFTRDLFAAHLKRLTAALEQRRRPLGVAVLRLNAETAPATREPGALERALPQIGSMIGRLVRSEDTAARLAPDLFALALPAATEVSAQIAAERIAAVVACTAFDGGSGRPPFTVDFDIGAAEIRPGEGAAQALERAAGRASRLKAG